MTRASSSSRPPTGSAARSCGGVTAPPPARYSSRMFSPAPPAPIRASWRTSTASCSLAPTMASMASSCGRATGLDLATSPVNVNGLLFFAANDGVHGEELWETNGTAAGTRMVKDINPGTGNGLSPAPNLTNINGKLYFGANNGVTGTELWKSNG